MGSTQAGGTWKVRDLFTRPHRFFGGPSLIDPILHPTDPYNLPPPVKPDPGEPKRNTMSTPEETDVPMDEWLKRRAVRNIATQPSLLATNTNGINPTLKLGGY